MPVQLLVIAEKNKLTTLHAALPLTRGDIVKAKYLYVIFILAYVVFPFWLLYPIEELLADVGTVYQKYISSSDADVLIEFYRTPAAQRLIDVQPAMVQEYLPLVVSRMETRVKAFADETAREAQELLKELLENQ